MFTAQTEAAGILSKGFKKHVEDSAVEHMQLLIKAHREHLKTLALHLEDQATYAKNYIISDEINSETDPKEGKDRLVAVACRVAELLGGLGFQADFKVDGTGVRDIPF